MKFTLKEWVKICGVLLAISLLLAAINPFTENYWFGFSIILAMFGATAIPFHIYMASHNRTRPEYYTTAGGISGAVMGMGYIVFATFPGTDGLDLSGLGIFLFLFGSGGALLGSLCGAVFWQIVVSGRYTQSEKKEKIDRQLKNTTAYILNLLGLAFGFSFASELIKQDVTGPLMTAYGFFAFSFPLTFFLAHLLVVRLLLKGSSLALIFILCEILFLLAKSLYNSLLATSFLGGIPVIALAIISFLILFAYGPEIFSNRQKAAFRYANIGIVFLLIGHILVTSISVLNMEKDNRQRSLSGEWHAQFQPQELDETEENAKNACVILKEALLDIQGLPFEKTVPHLSRKLKEANLRFSDTMDISESRIRYIFKPVKDRISKPDVAQTEMAVIHHVMEGQGVHEYASWKAKYGLFFEQSYDIFYTPRQTSKLDGPYLTEGSESALIVSIPLKDPLYMKDFWKTAELQNPPSYLKSIMRQYGYKFAHVELWDVMKFNYVYDLNGLVSQLLLSDVYFFNVTLEYLAKREQDQSVTNMVFRDISCSFPFRGELYGRPKGISHSKPHYPEYRTCHSWRATLHCPSVDIQHTTNICRQLGAPFPSCTESDRAIEAPSTR